MTVCIDSLSFFSFLSVLTSSVRHMKKPRDNLQRKQGFVCMYLSIFFLYIYNLHVFKQKIHSHQVLIYLNVPGILVEKPLQNSKIDFFVNISLLTDLLIQIIRISPQMPTVA